MGTVRTRDVTEARLGIGNAGHGALPFPALLRVGRERGLGVVVSGEVLVDPAVEHHAAGGLPVGPILAGERRGAVLRAVRVERECTLMALTADASEVEVRDGVFVSFAKRADNNVIRETLASLAAAVVGSDDGGASLSQRERLTLLSVASLKGVAARDGITALEAEVGFAEAQIDKAAVNAEAERTVLEIARNKIVARDPFEAATEFTALESQVQAIFAVTARLSSLSLTGFLR